MSRSRLRRPTEIAEDARPGEAPARAVSRNALAKPIRLPVPALEPPDRAEARWMLTIGVLAASALLQVLSTSADWLAGWDRFGELVARLLN